MFWGISGKFRVVAMEGSFLWLFLSKWGGGGPVKGSYRAPLKGLAVDTGRF